MKDPKEVWLRGEEPQREPITLWHILGLIAAIAFMLYYGYLSFLALPADAQMCGDCNNDHKVEVSELVKAVSNALNGDPCHEGCAATCFDENSPNCPCDSCFEFPVVNHIVCSVSMCNDSPEQVASCHGRFMSEHPDSCHSIGGAR